MPLRKRNVQLLIVEDNTGDYLLMQHYLEEEMSNVHLTHAKTFSAAKDHIDSGIGFEAILLDLSLPDASGEKLVNEIVQLADDIPVIVFTGYSDKDFGVRSLSLGISDYLLKDELNAPQLYKSIAYSIERKRISKQLNEAEQKAKRHDLEITKAIINAQEQERYQIGGELHDNVNQLLAGVQLALGMAEKELLLDEIFPLIKRSKDYISMAIAENRRLSHRLAPASFDENSLPDAFENLLESINIQNKYRVNLSFNEFNDEFISDDLQLNLYRILQEQLNNILKYSEANSISIDVMQTSERISMRTSDDGKGFDMARVKRGIGISNIKKRTELFSGRFKMNASPGNGCEMIVEIPI